MLWYVFSTYVQAAGLDALIDSIMKTFTPPATPVKANKLREETKASVPNSPVKATQVKQEVKQEVQQTNTPLTAVVPVVSGGRVDISKLTRPDTYPRSYYIVYHGKGGHQGLFEGWKSVDDDFGADLLCDGYEHRISKRFNDKARAQMYFDECKDSGVFDLLQDVPCDDEVFFVLKGAQPGVYTKRCVTYDHMPFDTDTLQSRLSFLIEGLAWRGGVVMSAIGTRAQADVQYKQWKDAGLVAVLSPKGPRRYFD